MHVRPDGTDTTYCGHACTEQDGWYVLPDTHPEDIDQLERCTLCYQRLPEYKKIAWS